MQDNKGDSACFDHDPLAKINGLSCSKASFYNFIRENLADCEEPYAWSDKYIDFALDMAILQVVNSNKEEFQRTKELTLINDECIQSSCDCCEGVIELVGNVNGKCNTPKLDVNDTDKWLIDMFPMRCNSEDYDYEIESYDILGDAGCQFKVNPKVPKTGIYIINILCVEYPNINGQLPKAICRHMNEIMFLSLGILHMLEDDRETLTEKADRWFNLYFKIVNLELAKDRDIFVEAIKFATRIDPNDE